MSGNKPMKALLAVACAMALCCVLVACGGSASSSTTSTASASSASASASAASDSTSSASTSASAASASATSASSSAASSSSILTTSKYAADLVDEHKNITLFSIMELTGPEITELLEELEYVWVADDSVWLREVDGAIFAAANEDGGWSKDAYAKATEKGGVATAMVANIVGGFEDGEAALSGNAHCVIEDSFFSDDGSGIAIVYGPSMEEHLAIVTQATESTFNIDLYSQEAVSSGLLNDVYGQEMGNSLLEVWQNVTGQKSFGR